MHVLSAGPDTQTANGDVCHALDGAGISSVEVGGRRIEWMLHERLRHRGLIWGALAGAGLLVVYLTTLALANSVDHALGEFAALWPWMTALVGGFSVQVGLFAYARGAARDGSTTPARGLVASGAASTMSMVACCAHHLADVLPLMGLAGAAVFFANYQSIFFLTGVLSNLVGILYVLGLIRRHRLYPERRSVLSLLVHWPVDRAMPPALIGSAIILLWAFLSIIL